MKLLVRLGASTVAGFGAALLSALVLALIDLYLTGHRYPSLRREIVSWEPAGVHMSAGDIGVLLATIIAAVIAWRSLGDVG